MQLGTRWPVGADLPPRIPADIGAAVRAVESDVAHLDTSAWRWTLTWLENRPIVELDDGTVVRYGPDGRVMTIDADGA
ncbi:MAG: hypothetical protein RI885_1146 [Actinomycetota bacterium]